MNEFQKMDEVIEYGKRVERELKEHVERNPGVAWLFRPILALIQWATCQAVDEKEELKNGIDPGW